MTGVDDLVFVIAAYGGILGAVAAYAVTLTRRLRRAREAAAEPEELSKTPHDLVSPAPPPRGGAPGDHGSWSPVCWRSLPGSSSAAEQRARVLPHPDRAGGPRRGDGRRGGRLGGLVLPGSLAGSATDLTFVLTDGETEITVHSTVAPTSSFREGAGRSSRDRSGPTACSRLTRSSSSTTRRTSRRPTIRPDHGRHHRSRRRRHRPGRRPVRSRSASILAGRSGDAGLATAGRRAVYGTWLLSLVACGRWRSRS